MITSYETKQIKLNADLRGMRAGTVLPIKVDANGVPVDRYWRDRLKDSEIDNCIEFATKKKKGGK